VCAIHESLLNCWERAHEKPAIIARDPNDPGDPQWPGLVAGPAGPFEAEQISSGYEHNCALRDGQVYCWGQAELGLLGSSGGPRGVPVKGDADFVDIVEISAGGSFSCARTRAGKVYCWGNHADVSFGQLTSDFEPTRTNEHQLFSETAFRIDSLEGATHIALGEEHGCAMLADGTPVCWGRNDFHQTGQTQSDDCPPGDSAGWPCVLHVTKVEGLGVVRQFALAEDHSCALEVGGTVRCWGRNGHIELGNDQLDDPSTCAAYGDFAPPAEPELCSAIPLENGYVEGATFIAARAHTSCAVKDGEVWCWGENIDNVLGSDTATAGPARVKLAGHYLENIVEIALGENIGCGLTRDSRLFCWGRDMQTDEVLTRAAEVPW
jgi:alpha-tubulin suppressor-like RCC1 family protein